MVRMVKAATKLPLPVGERIEVRGLGVSSLLLCPLTPLSFAESTSPPRGEGR
jgi:hypothetical protein